MSKKKKELTCPYRDIIIRVGSGKPIYWCGLFPCDTKECVSQEHKFDYKECSHYLFPKDTILKYGDKEKWILE